MMPSKPIKVGEHVGKLKVLSLATSDSSGYRTWLCRCRCGNRVERPEKYLIANRRSATYSCGCSIGEARRKNALATHKRVLGHKFGRLTPLQVAQRRESGDQNRTFWKCRCDCGNELIVSQNALVSGGTLSCGCGRRKPHAKPSR